MKRKYVERFKTRHGKTMYYFSRTGHRRIRLPDDPLSEEFALAYDLAFKTGQAFERPDKDEPVRRKVEGTLKSALATAKVRAGRKKREFSITLDWALDQVERQGLKCALTGIQFFAPAPLTRTGRHPYSPSLDRIDTAKGYTPENVRIVILSINLMLADWGDEVFCRVVNGYRYGRRGEQTGPKVAQTVLKNRPKLLKNAKESA